MDTVVIRGQDYIPSDLDYDVEFEVVELPSGGPGEKQFTELAAKAIARYATRIDYIIKEKGFDDLYEKHLTWRELVVAVQEIKQGQAEIKKVEEGLEVLKREATEILDWVEREGGPEARERFVNSIPRNSPEWFHHLK